MSCPDLVTGSAPGLHPEGVAYSVALDRFLVGSVTRGTVSVLRPDGSVRTLVDDPALITTMGLAVDQERGRVLAVNADLAHPSTAGLGVYDVHSGQRIAYHDLGSADHARFGNDVALSGDGTAFVTDSLAGAVYRVPLDGPPSVLVRDDRLLPLGGRNGANGVVWHPDGFLLVANSTRRALFRVADGVVEVRVDGSFGMPDGLLLDGDGALHVVDNSVANRVLSLRSVDGWVTAGVSAVRAWPDPAPTTMARSGCGVYVLSGRLDLLPGGEVFLLRRLG